MQITETKTVYFVVWTTHGIVIHSIIFDEELWKSMRSNFEMFYKDFYLKSGFLQEENI